MTYVGDKAKLAKRRILGERVDLMRNGHLYWTLPFFLSVDEQMRVSLDRGARIFWKQSTRWTNVGIQRLGSELNVYLPAPEELGLVGGHPTRWMPELLTGEDRAHIVPVTGIIVSTLTSDLHDPVTGQAILPRGFEAPVVGQLDDGGRGYLLDLSVLGNVGIIKRETPVFENPGGTAHNRCERDGDDLLVEVGGRVLRLAMFGELVPGRQGRSLKIQADSPEPTDYILEPSNLAGRVSGRGTVASMRRTRAGIADSYMLSSEVALRERREAGRRARAVLPSLRERAPARPGGSVIQ